MARYRKLDLDQNQKERIIFHSEMLHYGLYMPEEEGYFYGDIPWHWHDEFEFGYLMGGSMLYKTSGHEYVLQKGDGIFINSGVPHYLHPLEPREKVLLQSQFVDRFFLAGAYGNLFDLKYITPVLEQKQLEAVPLYHREKKSRKVLEQLKKAAKLSLTEPPFFELHLRNTFSEIWESVYGWAEELRESGEGNAPENERIKRMLSFAQEHYQEHLTVEQIAYSVPLSERECYRMFKNSLGITPMEYVISLRMQKAQELLRDTGKSILEVAMESGFGTSSYLGLQFKQHYHMTPKQYRKNYAE